MINDIKWVQAQRKATDWRQAVEIATRPLVAYGAAQPCYVNGIIENTLNWGPYYLIAPESPCLTPDQSKAQTIIRSVSPRYAPRSPLVTRSATPSGCFSASAPRMPTHIF